MNLNIRNRIALLSDIHGNSPALEAVLQDIQRENCMEVFVLGDIINGVDPHGCVRLLGEWSDTNRVELTCIKGNAEAYLTTPERGSLPRQNEEWNADMMNLVQWWQDHLTESDLEWISAFPDTVRMDGMLLVHDSPLDRLAVQSHSEPEIKHQYREWFFHGRGVIPQMPENEWQELFGYMDAENLKRVFCGHTHIPFYRELSHRLVCNIGSAGATLDGDPRPSWVLLTQSSNGDSDIQIRRVDYDINLIHDLIEQTPDYYDFKDPTFKEAYKKWLATGIHWREHYKS